MAARRGRPPKEKRPPGRPTKCTKVLTEKVCQAIAAGAYLETAAAFAGINKDTLHDWLRKGARAADEGKHGIHRKFNEEVQKALADSELNDLATISLHAQGYMAERDLTESSEDTDGKRTAKTIHETRFRRDWQAAAWRLERKHPGRWGRRLAVTAEDGAGLPAATVIILPRKDDGEER
jgi:hypothetical protein